MNLAREDTLIRQLVRGFTRSPLQMNQLHESDTELLRLPGTELVLAVTTDAIVEEIEQGLYEDPYQIGWMTITVSASDLAASAADPMGVLVTETLPSGGDSEFLNELQRGIRDACDFYSLPLLGGDTNFSSRVATCAVALGTVPSGSVLTRRGCRPNDLLFTSGPLGLGSSYALRKLAGDGHDPVPAAEFLPKARLAESRVLRRQASAAMDTSDGMIATVDQLMRLNNVGFEIELPVERFLHQGSAYMAECAEIPTWMMLAGPHGEFELLFTVPPQRSTEFRGAACSIGWSPIELGVVVSDRGLRLSSAGQRLEIDTSLVKDVFFQIDTDIEHCLQRLSLTARAI